MKKIVLSVVVSLLLINAMVVPCLADAPTPPSVLIIVPHAPKELVLTIGSVKPERKDKVFESYFAFYFPVGTNIGGNVLQVTISEITYNLKLPENSSYFSTFTLDLATRTITPGASPSRPYQFAFITLFLTLIIEGVIFYLFGYRKIRSWVTFVVANLGSQGFLYVTLAKSVYPSFYGEGTTLGLVLGEFFVFFIEIAIFLLVVNEHPRWRTLCYVIIANIVSLILGAFIMNALL